MSGRAWTDGPWAYDSTGMTMDDSHTKSIRRDVRPRGPQFAHVRRTSDAELIALAPELAEAVLAYGENPSVADPRTVGVHDKLLALADRLRQIGGDA